MTFTALTGAHNWSAPTALEWTLHSFLHWVSRGGPASRDAHTPTTSRKQIRAGFMRAAEVDAKRVFVDVEGGHLTLSRAVRAWFERIRAERGAWRALGAVSVPIRGLGKQE